MSEGTKTINIKDWLAFCFYGQPSFKGLKNEHKKVVLAAANQRWISIKVARGCFWASRLFVNIGHFFLNRRVKAFMEKEDYAIGKYDWWS